MVSLYSHQERQRKKKKMYADEYTRALKQRIKLHEHVDEWRHKETAKLHMDKMVRQ